jgi:hypothetical protein
MGIAQRRKALSRLRAGCRVWWLGSGFVFGFVFGLDQSMEVVVDFGQARSGQCRPWRRRMRLA